MNYALVILKRFALLFAIPYAELVLLRFLISREDIYRYLILLFSPGLIFYAVIPFAIAFVVLVLLLDKKEDPLTLTLQKKILKANFIFFIAFLLIGLNLKPLHSLLGKKWLSFIWSDMGLLTFSTSLAIFIDFKSLLHKIRIYPLEAFFSAFAGSLFYLFHVSIEYFWPYLSRTVTFIVYRLLTLFGFDMIYAADGHTLTHPAFTASVGAACSGLEGIFLFLFLFSLILLVDWGSYSFKKALFIYLLGIAYMFALNVLRVTAFFGAAIWATQKWGQTSASHIFVWFFHANVGWIFYLIGITIFFSLLFRFQRGRKIAPHFS